MSARTPLEENDDQSMLHKLDTFLDEQADDHRRAMESVVAWLEGHGSLEEEIQKSVASISSLFQKWTFEILFLLRLRGRMRFNQLKEELGGVGPATIGSRVKDLAGVGSRTLSQRLKELEARGLVQREVFPEVPVRVEYSLTDKGLRFGDLIMPSIAFMRLSAIENGEE